jgi:hypothetical protein
MRLSARASLMSLEQFQAFDKEMIEKLGRDQIGRRRWNKLSEEEKIQETYEILSDPSEHEEGLKDSNFDKFWQSWSTLWAENIVNASLLKARSRRLCVHRRAVAGGIANHVFRVPDD